MKKSIKSRIAAVIAAFALSTLITNAIYTIIYRFTEPNPATRWLPLYDRIYNAPNKYSRLWDN